MFCVRVKVEVHHVAKVYKEVTFHGSNFPDQFCICNLRSV